MACEKKYVPYRPSPTWFHMTSLPFMVSHQVLGDAAQALVNLAVDEGSRPRIVEDGAGACMYVCMRAWVCAHFLHTLFVRVCVCERERERESERACVCWSACFVVCLSYLSESIADSYFFVSINLRFNRPTHMCMRSATARCPLLDFSRPHCAWFLCWRDRESGI